MFCPRPSLSFSSVVIPDVSDDPNDVVWVCWFAQKRIRIAGSTAGMKAAAARGGTARAHASRSGGKGRRTPPRRTVSTAAWQRCQLPEERSPTAPFTGFTVLPHASSNSDWNSAGRWWWGTAEMKDMRSARPKNLATKRVAWAWASGPSIHCKHGRRMHSKPFQN